MWDMTYPYVGQDSFINEKDTELIAIMTNMALGKVFAPFPLATHVGHDLSTYGT